MPLSQFSREKVHFHPLSQRANKVVIERDRVLPEDPPRILSPKVSACISRVADRIKVARDRGAPVVMAFGAHTIKNGLGPVLAHLVRSGWIQHLATNGAGVIHDWEFAFLGESSEDVRANVAEGKFGIWQETGFNINLAILLGAYDGLGYGESVGRLISTGRHAVPGPEVLGADIAAAARSPKAAERAAAAADLLAMIKRHDLPVGERPVEHPYKSYSIQAAAYDGGIPFTSHPMFGHDIIYTHPLSHGAAIGRAAERDFLAFVETISHIDGGVYLSVGSAVMSPMIFEKSLSMARNVALQSGRSIDDHFIAVVDLAENQWDWSTGEPPTEAPEYYLRYCKTFSRMGGTMSYIQADNRDFLLHLVRALKS